MRGTVARHGIPRLCWWRDSMSRRSLLLSNEIRMAQHALKHEDNEESSTAQQALTSLFKIPASSTINHLQTSIHLSVFGCNQVSRFSTVASSKGGKESFSSQNEPLPVEEKVEQVSTSEAPTEEQVEGLNAKEAAESEVMTESDDEVIQQEEQDLIGLLEEKESLLQQKEMVIAELKDRLLRTLAEAENLSNRARREAESTKKYAIQTFAKDLLDVADNLVRAAATVPEGIRVGETTNDSRKILKTLLEGVEMTEKQLMQAFKKHGIEKFDPAGQPFDPNQHLALFEVKDASKTPGTVATVLKVGYMLHDRVIRPSEVGVIKQETEADVKQEPEESPS